MIVTPSTGFPRSGAAANVRVRSFARGLHEAGARVSVHMLGVVVSQTEVGASDGATGRWRGVDYSYEHGSVQPVSSWLRRRVLEVRGVWRMARAVLGTSRSYDRSAVILWGPYMRYALPLKVACTLARVPLLHQIGEFPFVCDGPPNPLGRLWRAFYGVSFFRLFDGLLVITTLLEDYLRSRIRRSAWILRVPILVDAAAFSCAETKPESGLVGYVGNLGHREELAQLVGAVAALTATHPDVRAAIVGGGDAQDIRMLGSEIADNSVEDRIEMVGPVPADEVPAWLCRCAVLALPRARGLFSSAGFPTKLGEYLASGRPVVVTSTGDIPLYLKPDVDAYLVDADDRDGFTAAMEKALYDPAAIDVGRSGRDVARREFDPTTHMRRVLEALGFEAEESARARIALRAAGASEGGVGEGGCQS